ncbi:MAG: hypothetical protein IIY21_12180 [Clostridiales bacterium]|nr:hypothetical protein [Clostridiales bacterium]MBQ1573154.1 hypothetical protein [Clostridiales bacterium]
MRDPATWIKLNRNILEWRWFTDGNILKVFIYLLLSANTKDIEYKTTMIHRGEVVRTQERIAEETRLTRQQVRTVLCKLEATKEITKEQRDGIVVISITNYDVYQDSNQGFNQEITKDQEEKEKRTKKEKEEGTRIKETLPKGSVKKNGVFTPPSVEEVSAYCLERGNAVDPHSFVSFYESKGWMIGKNRMKDWRAAVRTWERNEKQKQTKKDIFSEDFWNDI